MSIMIEFWLPGADEVGGGAIGYHPMGGLVSDGARSPYAMIDTRSRGGYTSSPYDSSGCSASTVQPTKRGSHQRRGVVDNVFVCRHTRRIVEKRAVIDAADARHVTLTRVATSVITTRQLRQGDRTRQGNAAEAAVYVSERL